MDELFNLCKEVYEKTGWGNPHDGQDWYIDDVIWDSTWQSDYERGGEEWQAPSYSIEYILDRLPDHIVVNGRKQGLRMIRRVSDTGKPDYLRYSFRYGKMYEAEADSPLIALLHLVIGLHEAGELK